MATLFALKAQLDADPDLEAVRIVPVSDAVATVVVYRDVDDYYTISDPDESHKESWRNWDHALAAVGNGWAGAEDWTIRVRAAADDLLTLQYVAKKLNVSEDTVRRWAKAGAIESIPLPSAGEYQSYRVRRAVLHDLLRRKSCVAVKVS